MYQQEQYGHPQLFKLAYCCYAASCDRISFLNYSMLWRAAIKFKYEDRADGMDCSSSAGMTWSFMPCPRRSVRVWMLVCGIGRATTNHIGHWKC